MELKMGKYKADTSISPALYYHGNFWGGEPTEPKREADVFMQPTTTATARGIANRTLT